MKSKKKNVKARSSLILVLILIASIICGYISAVGIGKGKVGSAKNIDLGLDLAGGVSITYEIQADNPTDTEIKDTIYKLQKRVEGYSTEAEVYKEGSKRISVEIPGVTNANEILEALGKPGSLSFQTEDGTEVVSGSDVKTAEPAQTEENGIKSYVVNLSFNEAGTKKFAEATTENVGNRILIIYDGETISAPTVNEAITGGECTISGMESYEAATELATTIRIGSLPLELKEMRSNVVGAQLGQDAIKTSLIAGAIGLGLICAFMLVVYRIPGLCACIALLDYIILTLLALNGFNATLTLPGIAGILLSIGMAVDANVIIFTRIKEELTAGRSVQNAIKEGFSKAFSAIIDGNITTLIAAVVLWLKGSGTVKGFAQTLGIGILLSMFTALFLTRLLLWSFYHLGVQDAKFFGTIKPLKQLDFIKISKVCMIFSAVVIVAGFAFLPINKNKIGDILNYSLEFQGGTAVTLTMKDDITDELDQKVVDKAYEVLGTTVQSQKVQDANQLVIKTSELSIDQREKLEEALKKDFQIEEFETENISSSVSNEMKSDAVVAVAIATICILIYIAVRFRDIKFGTSAVIALIHDVLVVFALYSIARLSVGNTFIACMLTIVGYSINDTIVTFDRIRENLTIPSERKKGTAYLVDSSISQTLARTIYTSLTTVIMVVVLYIIGVPSIKEFALTLIAGVVCGTYSSICLASPIWYYMKTKGQKEEGKPALAQGAILEETSEQTKEQQKGGVSKKADKKSKEDRVLSSIKPKKKKKK